MRSRCLKTCSDRLSYPFIKPVHNVTLVTLIYTTTDSQNMIKIRDKSVSIWLAMLFVGCVANVWIPVLVARYFNFSSFLTLAKIQYSAKSEIFVFPETSGLAWHCFQGGDHWTFTYAGRRRRRPPGLPQCISPPLRRSVTPSCGTYCHWSERNRRPQTGCGYEMHTSAGSAHWQR